MHPHPLARPVALIATAILGGGLLTMIGTAPASAHWVHRTLYASPTGTGVNCTSGAPCSLERARDKVRTMNSDMKGDIVVNLLDGTYVLDETFELTENDTIHDSGSNGFDVIYRNAPGAHPVISGGEHVDGSAFTLADAGKNIYRAPVDPDLESRYLYVNGQRATRARSSDAPGFRATATGYRLPATGKYSDMGSWGNVTDIEVATTIKWRHARFSVESISGTAMTMDDPGWTESNTQPGYTPRKIVWIENAYELLDDAGEWYFDRSADAVYYIPREGESVANADFVLSRTTTLVNGSGTLSNPLHNLRFEGLQFSYDNWLDPSGPMGYPDAQGGVIYRGPGDWEDNHYLTQAGVNFENVRNIAVTNSTFKHMANAALAFGTGSHDNVIDHNTFTDISGNGINLGDITKAAHHPDDPAAMVTNNTISNNTISKVGVEFHDNVAIFVGYTQGTDVRHNTLHDLPYTGISIGWGWGYIDSLGPTFARNNVVRGNLIYDFMKELPDGGGIYTIGNQPGSRVVDNYLYGDKRIYGNIYHDAGTSGFHDTNNVISNKDALINVWLNINSSLSGSYLAHDNHAEANFVSEGMYKTGGNRGGNSVTGTIAVPNDDWPAPALEVIENAGVGGRPITPVQVGDRPISRDRSVATSSANGAHDGALAVDGDPATHWMPVGEVDEDRPAWLEVDLGEDHLISGTDIASVVPKGKGATYRIEVSRDADTWSTYADHTESYTVPGRDSTAEPVRARFMRLVVTSFHGPGGGISEFEVFGSPIPPASQGKDATASSSYSSNYDAAKAVDGDATTRWAQASGAPDPSSLTVDLDIAHHVSRVETQAFLASGRPVKFSIEHSNDHVNWSTYADHTASYVVPGVDLAAEPVTARYWRITFTDSQGQGGSISEFRVFGEPSPSTPTVDPVDPPDPDTLLSQGKAASASSIFSAEYDASKAVDGDAGTRWAQVARGSDPSWLMVDLGAVHDVTRVETSAYLASGRGVKYLIEYSTDNTAWSTYADRTAEYVTPGTDVTGTPVAARYLRITLTDTQSQGGSINEFQVFGN